MGKTEWVAVRRWKSEDDRLWPVDQLPPLYVLLTFSLINLITTNLILSSIARFSRSSSELEQSPQPELIWQIGMSRRNTDSSFPMLSHPVRVTREHVEWRDIIFFLTPYSWIISDRSATNNSSSCSMDRSYPEYPQTCEDHGPIRILLPILIYDHRRACGIRENGAPNTEIDINRHFV